MPRRTTRRWMAVIAVFAVAVIAGAGIYVGAAAVDDFGDDDQPITGTALERASEAALAHVGEGRVTDTEIGDEEGYYEVEVTLDDGSEVDVHLDESFNVLGAEEDGRDDDD